MRTLGKLIGWIALAIIILYIIAALVLHYAIKPSTYKSFVESTVYKYTGHKMMINGKLEWSVFPNPAVKITKVLIKNHQGEDSIAPYFAKVDEADIKLSLMPLFSGQIEPSKIILRNAHLNLVYQSPKNNPQPLKPTATEKQKNKLKLKDDKSSRFTRLQHISLPKALISRSELNLIDLKDNQITSFKNIHLFVDPSPEGASIKGRLSIQRHQDEVMLSIKSKLKFENNRNSISLQDITLDGSYRTPSQVDKFKLAGDVKLDINKGKAALDYKINWNKLAMQGQCQIGFTQTKMGADMTYQAITKVSGGRVDERGTYHLLNSGPDSLDYTLSLQNVNIAPLMEALHYGNRLQGTANISAHLTTNNKNHSWLKNLNGRGSFSLKQAQFGNLTIADYIDQALKLMHRKPIASNDGLTIFSNVAGTFQLHNGVFYNRDLNMQAPRLLGNGSGNVNFVNNRINYLLSLQHKSEKDIKIPLKIGGTIQYPQVSADLTKLGTSVIQKTLKKKLFKNILNGKKFNFDKIF